MVLPFSVPVIFMFVLKTTVDAVVTALEKRISELTQERDYYRNIVLFRNTGETFNAGITRQEASDQLVIEQIEQTVAAEKEKNVPRETLSEGEKIRQFRLDRGAWTADDYALFEQYFELPEKKRGTPPEEMDYRYAQRYGTDSPLKAFLA